MYGCVNGVQTKVIETVSVATSIHCSSYVFNLILNTACSVPKIRYMFDVVKDVTNFINELTKKIHRSLSTA